MRSVDLEVEYNNRARVPEHPQIFARWARDAAAYRARTTAEKRAELGLKYGASARQTIDLFHGAQEPAGPLALFIHGGYWRSLEPGLFSHMAAGLNARGVTVAVAGYDLCPQVTISTIIDEVRAACLFLWRRFGRPFLVYGHSAGGHLSGTMLATDWRAIEAGAPERLVPAACSISGLFDLTPLTELTMNEDLRLDRAEAHRVSPLFWPAPKGTRFDSLVGALESSEFLRQARVITEVWGKGGVAARYDTVPDTNHFTVCDGLTDPTGPLVQRLVELAPR